MLNLKYIKLKRLNRLSKPCRTTRVLCDLIFLSSVFGSSQKVWSWGLGLEKPHKKIIYNIPIINNSTQKTKVLIVQTTNIAFS
jgi:hypothetical protein